MATQTTPFQGTKFYLGVGYETEKAITACSVTPNATITATGNGFIRITGLGALDGCYPVKSVSTDTVTLADEVDWKGFDKPTNFAKAKVSKIQLSSNFCAIKQIDGHGDTLCETDITRIRFN